MKCSDWTYASVFLALLCLASPSYSLVGGYDANGGFPAEASNNKDLCNASRYSGADIGAAINAAKADGCESILIPAGKYTYTTDIAFSTPGTLKCETGSVLDYAGTGFALQLGSLGYTYRTQNVKGTKDTGLYEVDGCTFTGGTRMKEGIYVAPAITNVILRDLRMPDFGNINAWNIFTQVENWYTLIDDLWMWIGDSASRQRFNGIKTAAADGLGDDHGNSRLIVTNSLIQAANNEGGTGIFLNGYHSQVSYTTIAGMRNASVQWGKWGNNTQIANSYFEMGLMPGPRDPAIPAVFLFGDGSGATISKTTLRDNYINLHNNPYPTTRLVMMADSTAQKIQGTYFEHNVVSGVLSGTYLFNLNNYPSQTNNYAGDNVITLTTGGEESDVQKFVHNSAGRIEKWNGSQGDGNQR
jgi:hypothetical protein